MISIPGAVEGAEVVPGLVADAGSDTSGGRIGQLEETLCSGLVRIPRSERLGERPDDLEAGQCDQRKGGEEDRVQAPRLDEADADRQDRDRRQPRHHR